MGTFGKGMLGRACWTVGLLDCGAELHHSHSSTQRPEKCDQIKVGERVVAYLCSHESVPLKYVLMTEEGRSTGCV
jgi:hypothetical protein